MSILLVAGVGVDSSSIMNANSDETLKGGDE